MAPPPESHFTARTNMSPLIRPRAPRVRTPGRALMLHDPDLTRPASGVFFHVSDPGRYRLRFWDEKAWAELPPCERPAEWYLKDRVRFALDAAPPPA